MESSGLNQRITRYIHIMNDFLRPIFLPKNLLKKKKQKKKHE